MIFAVLTGAVLGTSAAAASIATPSDEQCQAYSQISDQGIKAQCRVIRVRAHYQRLCAHPSDPILTAGSPLDPCQGWPKIIRALKVGAHYAMLCEHQHHGIGTAGGGGPSPCLGWRQRTADVLAQAKRSTLS